MKYLIRTVAAVIVIPLATLASCQHLQSAKALAYQLGKEEGHAQALEHLADSTAPDVTQVCAAWWFNHSSIKAARSQICGSKK